MKVNTKPSVWDILPELQQPMKPDLWVKLLDLPTPFSHDEALLLCQESEEEWRAWIPNHGEIVLHRGQFVSAS